MSDHIPEAPLPLASAPKVIRFIERAIFALRWMLIPIYLGLVVALGAYIAHFVHEVIDMLIQFWTNYSAQNVLMLFILELVDMAMISQLVVMTIQGGYAIFIRPFDLGVDVHLPQWIKHGLGTSEQKIKMGMSIIGIMIVHFLKDFIQMSGISQNDLFMREQMLACVIVSTFAFCLYNLMMHHPMLHGNDTSDKDHHA